MKKIALVLALPFMLISCGGEAKDVEGFAPSDPDMAQAYLDARNSVDDFILLMKKDGPTKRYLVKFRVEADGIVEHMWGDLVKLSGDSFEGRLVNQPAKIKSIKIGDALTAPKSTISDWAVLSDKDEIIAGGFTIKVMQRKNGSSP